MSEQKHFSYEAKEPVVVSPPTDEPPDIEITDIVFLTPAEIHFKRPDGSTGVIMAGMDLVDRQAHVDGRVWAHSDKTFEYLDSVSILPENFFEASEDIYDKAGEAIDELEAIRKRTREGVE